MIFVKDVIINEEEMLCAVKYTHLLGYVYGDNVEEKGTTVHYKNGKSIEYAGISPSDIMEEINKNKEGE